MTRNDMTEERFLTLAGAYGADMARWPASERAAAEAFAAASPTVVEACLTAERLLDAALGGYATREPSAALRSRVHAAAPRGRAARALRWLSGAGVAVGLAASAAAGVAAGYILGHPAVASLMTPSADAGELGAGADSAGDAAIS